MPFGFWQWHAKVHGSLLAAELLDLDFTESAHLKCGHLRRVNRLAVNFQEEIAWLNLSGGGRASVVNVLEHPAGASVDLAGLESSPDGVIRWNLLKTAMKKYDVAYF